MLLVRCHTCGKPISAHLDRFLRLTEREGRSVKDALDELGMKRDCCRVHFICYQPDNPIAVALDDELVPGIARINRTCQTKRWVVAR